MARLRNPRAGELVRLEQEATFLRPALVLLTDKSLWFETPYYARRFGGVKSIRKFAFAILDATGGREES